MADLYAPPQHVSAVADGFWYHTMDLPGYGTVPGLWDLRGRVAPYLGYVPLAGRRVLDVGCASGFLSFAAEAAGATVVSMDMDTAGRQHLLPFADSLYLTDHAAWVTQQTAFVQRWHRAYWLAHRVLGSRARVYYGDVYALPAALGLFDVVLVGAVLEHLGDPLRALASIAPRCRDTLVLCTVLYPHPDPVAHFAGRAATPAHNYTFWVWSLAVYREVLGMLGLAITHVHDGTYWYAAGQTWEPRQTVVARRLSPLQAP